MEVSQNDIEALKREKYAGVKNADMTADIARLAAGEPLAYIIGHIPFLGLSIDLASRPLIPRPETEWWTEELITHLTTLSKSNRIIYDTIAPVQVLDLCAGSGAIGLAIAKHCPHTKVSLGELVPEHCSQILKNMRVNEIKNAEVRVGDLFAPFAGETFDLIVANPPYIPESRSLPESVTRFEPPEALYAGPDGLSVINRILCEAPVYLKKPGEVWVECDAAEYPSGCDAAEYPSGCDAAEYPSGCDVANIEIAAKIAMEHGASHVKIRTDQYGRPRLLVAYY